MKEIEMQDKTKLASLPLDTPKFVDVIKHIRLTHPFQKKEAGKYFLHFEKAA